MVRDHLQALKAFRFASTAMRLQRQHTTNAALRESTGTAYPEAHATVMEQGPKAASWRPFQLAFMLLNLPPPAHRLGRC